MKAIVGVGAGGHARVLIDIIRLSREFEIVGLIDPAHIGEEVDGIGVIGSDGDLAALRLQGIEYAFVAIGGAGDNRPRRAIFDRLQSDGFQLARLVHPSAVVAGSAQLSLGVAIMANAVVNPGAALAENVIVNTSAVVEHDCVVEAHVHVATGARLAGGVRIGEGAHVGAGAVVRQGISVGSWSVIGAGAVVVSDVPSGATVVGVPARPIRSGRRDG